MTALRLLCNILFNILLTACSYTLNVSAYYIAAILTITILPSFSYFPFFSLGLGWKASFFQTFSHKNFFAFAKTWREQFPFFVNIPTSRRFRETFLGLNPSWGLRSENSPAHNCGQMYNNFYNFLVNIRQNTESWPAETSVHFLDFRQKDISQNCGPIFLRIHKVRTLHTIICRHTVL